MRALRLLAVLAAGLFLLIGSFTTVPFSSLARQAATPPAEEEAGEDEETEEDETEEKDEAEEDEGEEEDDEDDGGDDDAASAAQEYTSDFYLDQCEWSSTSRNLFFRLDPGLQLILRGEEDGTAIEAIITVLDG